MDGTREAATARLQELLRLCEARGIAGSFEYVQVNEDGDEVSALVTVK